MTNSITQRFIDYLNDQYEGSETLTINVEQQFESLAPIYLMKISQGDNHAELLWDLERLQQMDVEGISEKELFEFFYGVIDNQFHF